MKQIQVLEGKVVAPEGMKVGIVARGVRDSGGSV